MTHIEYGSETPKFLCLVLLGCKQLCQKGMVIKRDIRWVCILSSVCSSGKPWLENQNGDPKNLEHCHVLFCKKNYPLIYRSAWLSTRPWLRLNTWLWTSRQLCKLNFLSSIKHCPILLEYQHHKGRGWPVLFTTLAQILE